MGSVVSLQQWRSNNALKNQIQKLEEELTSLKQRFALWKEFGYPSEEHPYNPLRNEIQLISRLNQVILSLKPYIESLIKEKERLIEQLKKEISQQ